jgi:hypothetical protein
LKKCGRFATATPPAMTMLLSLASVRRFHDGGNNQDGNSQGGTSQQ